MECSNLAALHFLGFSYKTSFYRNSFYRIRGLGKENQSLAQTYG